MCGDHVVAITRAAVLDFTRDSVLPPISIPFYNNNLFVES